MPTANDMKVNLIYGEPLKLEARDSLADLLNALPPGSKVTIEIGEAKPVVSTSFDPPTESDIKEKVQREYRETINAGLAAVLAGPRK